MAMLPGLGRMLALVAALPILAQTIPVKVETLSNGMRLLMVERRGQPTIAAGWVVRAGSANERPGITGMAHLFEHMMFKGSRTIGSQDIRRDLELNDLQDALRARIREEEALLRARQKRGEIRDMYDPAQRSPRHQQLLEEFGRLVKEQQDLLVKGEFDTLYTRAGGTGPNAFTSQDVTFYFDIIPSNKLEFWTWMESDRLREPVFREFYAERDVVAEERRMSTDSTPLGKFQELYESMLWEAHPYHWPVLGWPSDLASITREEANTFFTTYYAPNNLTAVLVGSFDPLEAMTLCERYFGRIPANPAGVPEVVTLEPLQVAEKRMVAEAETTPMVVATFKTVPDGHRDEPALMLLAALLNKSTGRLHKALVLGSQVASSAQAEAEGRKYAGTFALVGTAAPGHDPLEVEGALYREVDVLLRDGIPDRELRKVKNQAVANAYRSMESSQGLMVMLAMADACGGLEAALDLPRRLEAVTREDILRVAAAYLVKENRTVAVYTRKATAPAPPAPKEAL